MVAAGDPVKSSDITTIEDYTIRKPLCRLIQQAAQSIANATDVALTFGSGSEDIDTHTFHDETTNNTRITPTVAGYYRISGTFTISAATDYQAIQAGFLKNGASVPTVNRIQLPSTATTSASRSINALGIFAANGSTDYFEFRGQQVNTAAVARNTNASGAQASTFECEFLRPL